MNMLVKPLEGREYILTDFIATKLSEKEFEELRPLNSFLFEGFIFIKSKNIDFTWWDKCHKYLTEHKLYVNQYFNCDFYGRVTRL